VKHETFRDAAVGEAFEVIEGRVLPSLTFLIEQASAVEAGIDAEARAEEIRRLARELEELARLFEMPAASEGNGSPPAA
jgi:hypothetical protein